MGQGGGCGDQGRGAEGGLGEDEDAPKAPGSLLQPRGCVGLTSIRAGAQGMQNNEEVGEDVGPGDLEPSVQPGQHQRCVLTLRGLQQEN